MVQHIDCRNLVIRKGDGTETYSCQLSGELLELDYIDEEFDCPCHTPL
jgi:hypothetical protein